MTTEYDAKKSDIYSDELKIDVASLKPLIIDLIKKNVNKTALDFGCGSGRFSKIMAELGLKVTALDVSKHQIELAKKLNNHTNISYISGGNSKLKSLESSSFDLILMNMVFPSLENVKESEEVINEFRRLIAQEGKLIISILHPLFLYPVQDINDRASDFNFENYFKEGHHYNAEAITTKNRVMKFRETHFSLDFISKLLEKNEFVINKIRESKIVPEISKVPVYLIFECSLLS